MADAGHAARRVGAAGWGARWRGASAAARESRFGLLLVSPTVLVTLLVAVVPFAWALLLSVQRVRLVDLQDVGVFGAEYTLDNFADVLTSSGFWESVRVTVAYTAFGTLGSVGLGLAAALVLRRAFPGRAVLRSLLLVPYAAPAVAAALLWELMLNPQFGIVNTVGTRLLGWREPVEFLSQRSGTVELLGLRLEVPLALTVVILFEAWRSFPFAFLFILARLQAIPGELVEAARVDGAVPSQVFRHIVLPQLKGVLTLLVVLRSIFIFQNFTDVFLLTGGAGGTEAMSVRMFNLLTSQDDVGGAAALGLVMAALLSVLLIAYVRVATPAGRGRS